MSDSTELDRCGLDGCTSQQCQSIGNHAWSAEFAVRNRYLSVWVDIDDRDRRPDELLLGVYDDPNGEVGMEVWLTAEEAEHIYHLLGSAIRRHAAYRSRPSRTAPGGGSTPSLN